MEAVKEITIWKDGSTSNHTYLLDGDKMVAYIKKDTTDPFYFKSPIKGFSRSGRKFETLKTNPFKVDVTISSVTKVQGSKGNVYEVDKEAGTCTCPGYTYRGKCKHVEQD
jgi:hypothetical protein